MSIHVKKLVVCAMCLALAVVTSMIKVYTLPNDGSITLFSMLFACLPGLLYGPALGIMSAVVYGILQFILGPYIVTPVQVLLDYPLAFGALGLSGLLYRHRYGLQLGYLLGCAGRWFFAFLSGWVFFGSYAPAGWHPALYSAAYNISYIGCEAILTLILLSIPAVQQALLRIRQQSTAGLSA